jgi:hypothetical protein
MVKGDFDGDAGSLVALFNERLRAKGAEAIYGRNAKLEELMKTATGDYELPQSPLELDRLTKEGKLEPSAIDFSVTSEDTLNTAVHNVYLDTVLAGWQTKALTGSQDVRSQNIIAHIQKKARAMEGENFTEEQIQNVSDAAHVMWAEALPQEVISAKKIQRYIDSPLASVKIRQMLGNLAGGEITEESFFDTLHENDSILDGISIAAIATKASSIEATDRWASEAMPFLEEVFAGQSHLRAVDPNKLIEGYVKYFKMSREEATTKVGLFVGEITSRNKPFIYDQYPDAAKIGIGLETVIETSKDKTKAITSLSQAMNKVKSKLGKNQTITDDEAIRRAMGEMNIGKETIQSVLDGFSGMTGRGEHRAIIGWEEVRPLLKNIKPAQYIGAGILATAGITALNMLFGDGTPSSPNDLPSVNNPALKDGRYNNLQENRTINNMPNSNISSNLITSSHNSFDSVMNHLHSNFGHNYSSVSVRHDGQDPYKEHLLQYN